MDRKDRFFDRASCPISRRRLMRSGCAAGLAAAGLGAVPKILRAAGSGKMRLRVVYVLKKVKQDVPNWPNLGFDFAPVMEKMSNALAGAYPEIEFLPAVASGPAAAEKIVAGDLLSPVDGYIVFQMDLWDVAVPAIVASGKPVLYSDFIYGGSGEVLIEGAVFLRSKLKNVGMVYSSSLDDTLAAIKCFQAVKGRAAHESFADLVARLRKERTPGPGDLSCLPDPLPPVSTADAIKKIKAGKILAVGYPGVSFFGLPMVPMQRLSFEELTAAWKAADPDQARAIADRWQASVASVEEVSRETLVSSAAMYLGMKALLKQRGANAVTVNCLPGFYSGKIPAYPCLGFYELLNEGLVGACECDVRSAATQIAVNAISGGRPGYISDPVIDTSTRRIIYAHCVASNRPFGPQGFSSPFMILTHSEDRKGASVRSLLPAGFMTTTIEIASEKKQILFHQAKTTGNDLNDRACRTKLMAEPIGDLEKLLTMWDKWGWHRVTVYGDLQAQVAALADALGYKVVPEA